MKTLTILTFFILIVSSLSFTNIPSGDSEDEIATQFVLNEISKLTDAQIIFDDVIGERYVSYWEHIVNDIEIKNDYILLHRNHEGNTVLLYEKQWRDIGEDLEALNDENFPFQRDAYSWKKKVLLLTQQDCNDFYTFYNTQKYPVLCWEVRKIDGTTPLYDNYGNQIGYGIPAPFKGFSLSGYHEPDYPDPWKQWRLNADSYFSKWCNSTISMSFPTPATITSYISNPDYELFFELAHGGHYYFKATATEYYYASNVEAALIGRSAMRFAFIGSCGGMDQTGPGSWSHAFRKGQVTDTVTVGYTGMAECPGWDVSLPWQNMMFSYMDNDYTIKDSFDIASAHYPTIAPCVVFVGDPTLKIKEEGGNGDDDDDDDDDVILPLVTIAQPEEGAVVNDIITITGTADNPVGGSGIKWVFVSIDNGEWKDAIGTTSWSYKWDTTTVDDGEHTISAVSSDGALESGIKTVTVTVKNHEDPEEEDPIPELTCIGSLKWTGIKAGITVYGEFTVENTGEPNSNLSWAITETPVWGIWSFSKDQGDHLTPEDGAQTITVTLTVPTEQNKDYSGQIKIQNTEDPEQYYTIPITLTTPKAITLIDILSQIFNHSPIPLILRILIQVIT